MRERARLCEPGSNNPAQQPGIHPHPPPPKGGGVWGERHPGGSEVVMEVFMFFRAEGWYPVFLESADQAVENALANPGTLRVETVEGDVVWPLPSSVN